MRPRPIMFVLPALGGGAARVVVTVLRHLDRRRFTPHLVVFYRHYGFWFRDEVPDDVTLHVLDIRRARHALPRLLRAIWRLRPAVIVSTQGYVNFMLLLTRPLQPRARLVIREVIGERYMEHNRFRGVLTAWYQRLIRGADRIVAQSAAVARDMTARLDAPPGQIVHLPNPVDVERLAAAGRAAPSPYRGTGPHVLAMGRLTAQKGFDLLLEAFAGVRAAGSTAELTIVGVGEEEERLRAQAARLGLAAAVHLVGFQERPYPFFAHADLFVLSSRYEGMPNAALEALACACPVVAFDCPHGVDEVVRDGVNGVLLPPEDVAGLRATLIRLLADPAERARLRAGTAATIVPFAAPTIAARWEDLLTGVVAGEGTPPGARNAIEGRPSSV